MQRQRLPLNALRTSASEGLGFSASSDFTVAKDPTYPCGSSLDATDVSDNSAWCMVDVSFTAAAAGITTGTLTIPSNQPGSPATVQLIGSAAAAPPANLALNQPISASSVEQGFVAANANDGNTSTYWESSDGTWPATLTVNLGGSAKLGSVVIDLPPSWPTRTQTLSVLGSTNDSTWTTLASSATYTWNPSTGSRTRHLRLTTQPGSGATTAGIQESC